MGHSISSLSNGGVVQPGGEDTAAQQQQQLQQQHPAATGPLANDESTWQQEAKAQVQGEGGGAGGEAEAEAEAEPGQEEAEEQEEQEEQEEHEENGEDEEEAGDVVTELPVLDVPDRFRNRQRRFSVSAEVDRSPADADGSDDGPRVVVPKAPEDYRRIRADTERCILFQGLEEEQRQIIFDAMEEQRVGAGDTVIEQGAEGDYFYVIASGRFEVFSRGPTGRGPEVKIWSYEGAGSFGELALMYNAPRSATVRAATDGSLWRVDRGTFRSALVNHNARQRRRYEEFLARVPLFANLTPAQRSSFADTLVPTFYESGRRVVEQGAPGDLFFIVEKGKARVTVRKEVPGGEPVEHKIDEIHEGGCFGERALITDEPRSASVWADGDLKVAAMGRPAYERLIGQVYMN